MMPYVYVHMRVPMVLLLWSSYVSCFMSYHLSHNCRVSVRNYHSEELRPLFDTCLCWICRYVRIQLCDGSKWRVCIFCRPSSEPPVMCGSTNLPLHTALSKRDLQCKTQWWLAGNLDVPSNNVVSWCKLRRQHCAGHLEDFSRQHSRHIQVANQYNLWQE